MAMVEVGISDEKMDRFLDFIAYLLYKQWKRELAESVSGQPEEGTEDEHATTRHE